MEAPIEFNEGLKEASAKGKLDNNPKFKAAVDAAPTKMVGQVMQNAMASGTMSNMPPQPSNVMGMAQPVFNPSTMAAANNIYGNMQMRQNAVGAPPVFKRKCNK
tara:strand:- start:144 stop:455 length:312 start_codon:yes stop_codon:yes gene_type:complete